MAMFLFFNQFGSQWDDFDENGLSEVITSGYNSFREIVLYVREWFRGEEVDANEITEVAQNFALRVLLFTYQTISWVIHYTCAVIIYVFSDADSMHEAVEYVRPGKNSHVYKSITSLIVYEKPISFDYNPFHWLLKMTRILLLGPLIKPVPSEHEDSFFSSGKLIVLVILSVFLYRSYYLKRRGLYDKDQQDEDEEGKENDRPNRENFSPGKYEGLIKWEAGLVRCNTDKKNDHLRLKISVNSNICSENPPIRYDEMIASSTASICKIVSDILTNTAPESQEVDCERSENVTPRSNEEPEEPFCAAP